MSEAEKVAGVPSKQSVWTRYRTWILAGVATGLCSIAAVVVLAAHVNSEKVKSISMRYVGDAPEIHDPKIPFRDDHLPDYKLKVQCDRPGFWIFNGATYTLGPIPNQSATGGLEFTLAGDIPGDKVQQITLIEDDGFDDDPVCSVQVSADKLEAKGYQFEIVKERSLRFGFERVWEGKLGDTVVFSVLVMILILIRLTFDIAITTALGSLKTGPTTESGSRNR